MCFPSMAGYNARTFAEAPDKALSLNMLQAYNPSLLSGYWDPMLAACVDEGTVLCLHIGGGMSLIKLAPEAPAECDYPHTDTTWPESPEVGWGELRAADVNEAETHKITWENACRFFGFDPFTTIAREDATVGALRARAAAKHIDTTRMSKHEWRKRNEAAGIGVIAR